MRAHPRVSALGSSRRVAARALRRPVAVALVALVLIGCAGDPGYNGRSTAEWAQQLATAPDSMARRAAADALGHVLRIDPNATRATEALVRALADSSDEVRLAAGTSLVHDQRLPRAAIPGLLAALADPVHAHTREHAASLLMHTTAADTARVMPALEAAARDSSATVRSAAEATLTRLRRSTTRPTETP